MQVTSAYLLGIHPGLPAEDQDPKFREPADREVSMYLPGGLFFGAFMLANVSNPLPEFWENYIEHFYIQYRPANLGPYIWTISVAQIKPAKILELAQIKPDLPKRINELYEAMFALSLKPRRFGGYVCPNILFSQLGPAESARTVEALASDAVALMGFEECATVPASSHNVLFVAAAYSVKEYESLGAFALEQSPFAENRIGIPRIVHDCLTYQSLIFILEDLDERAGRLPFVQKTVSEYLSVLKGTKGRGRSYSKRFLTFLQHSETAAMELKAVEDLHHLINNEAARNGFAAGIRTSTPIPVRMPTLIYGSVLEMIAKDYRTADEQVRNDLEVGADRQKSIGDYLRDAANSEATLINMRLQWFVILLAALTVLVGIAALIPGMFTDDQKRQFWDHVPKWSAGVHAHKSARLPKPVPPK